MFFISNLGVKLHLFKAFREVIPAVILDENIFMIRWRTSGIGLSSFKEELELITDIKKRIQIKIVEES